MMIRIKMIVEKVKFLSPISDWTNLQGGKVYCLGIWETLPVRTTEGNWRQHLVG